MISSAAPTAVMPSTSCTMSSPRQGSLLGFGGCACRHGLHLLQNQIEQQKRHHEKDHIEPDQHGQPVAHICQSLRPSSTPAVKATPAMNTGTITGSSRMGSMLSRARTAGGQRRKNRAHADISQHTQGHADQ